MKKVDEMEAAITLKSIKISWIYTSAFLVIWCIYQYVKHSELGVPFILFLTQNIVMYISVLILRKKWVLEMKNRIKELRKKNNYTQEDLANFLNVTRQTINAIENNKYNPSLELAIKLSKVLKTKVEELFLINN